MPRGIGDIVDRVLGSAPAVSVGRALAARKIRVLAYHGVDDPETFERQMHTVTEGFRPVSAEMVIAAVSEGGSLPPHAVWVTFDDGHRSVVENAFPILEAYGIPSTIFVCPGVVGTDRPFWWQTVATALVAGAAPTALSLPPEAKAAKRLLKAMPDRERRALVADMERRLVVITGSSPSSPQLTVRELKQYLAAGGSVGNHTWDHPCLNRCEPEEQRRQIEQAHRWLGEHLGTEPRLFAYPNGNHTESAESVLAELGYAVAVLFDHRLGDPSGYALRMSRLRVNDYTDAARFAAILSGWHPLIHGVRVRLGLVPQPPSY